MAIERLTTTDTPPALKRLEAARRRLDADTLEYLSALEAASLLGSQTPIERPAQLLTIVQVAERLSVSDRFVKSLIASGKLPHRKLGTATRIAERDLEAFIAESAR